MAKHDQNSESFSAGDRTERAHADDGWQLGGRKDEGASFDQTEADARADRYAERPHGYRGTHRA